ncbi:uncharacterized protein LOC113205791 [Frankliniella occidentalis]|uniref:Uncharacterized protein LOC113205791 n=1 Tax=Frankliniella occidentalis TaxID=133901 RepID=A0A6J1SDF0_FRAOC|nr:uncharacterized protein LOC113205791 [Frankliniella occidentalis]
MGKVRRLRKKYHLACQKADNAETDSSTPIVPVVQSVPGRLEVPVKLNSDANIFAGLTISLSDLKQTLLPQPTTAVLGSVSEASVVGSQKAQSKKPALKKDRRLVRREELLKKLEVSRQAVKAAKKPRVPKQPKPMSVLSLMDALSSLTASNKEKKTSTKSSQSGSSGSSGSKVQRVRGNSSKQKRKQLIDNMKAYKNVLSNKHYKTDPFSAISNYLQKTVAQNSSWQAK